MPWGKTKSINLGKGNKNTLGQGVQGTYKKKEVINCKSCPHKPKQEENKTGKLSKIL